MIGEDGRELVIVSRKLEEVSADEETLLSIYIQDPAKKHKEYPYSTKRVTATNPPDELKPPAEDTAARLSNRLDSRPAGSANQAEVVTTQSRGITEDTVTANPGTVPDSNIPESGSVWDRVANAVRRVLGMEEQTPNEVEVPAPDRLQEQGLTKEATGVPEEELLTKELDAVIEYREDGTPVTGREYIRSETAAADEINRFADVLPDASECVYRNNGI